MKHFSLPHLADELHMAMKEGYATLFAFMDTNFHCYATETDYPIATCQKIPQPCLDNNYLYRITTACGIRALAICRLEDQEFEYISNKQ